ncbi:hypothetical protein NPIL_195131 [Nephila pilipes]|uniref:Uncharacterized protein n=1 Tax=Nephila pilipes TaxID=299642 RepID=A0A8X6N4T5_NEPPI|nr:hypothetical protein NPIL_195131 [Nephila pilipes]
MPKSIWCSPRIPCVSYIENYSQRDPGKLLENKYADLPGFGLASTVGAGRRMEGMAFQRKQRHALYADGGHFVRYGCIPAKRWQFTRNAWKGDGMLWAKSFGNV